MSQPLSKVCPMHNARDSVRQEAISSHQQFRRLDHLGNIQEGCGFSAIPDVLMDAFLNGDMPESKFKLICVMLRHSATFKIKRAYLDNRFSQKTLQKYLPEIEAEGFIRKEKVQLANGSRENVYHTNRIEFWKFGSDTSSRPSLGKPSVEHPSLGKPLKETKGKKTKEKKTNSMDGWKNNKASRDVQETTKPEDVPASQPKVRDSNFHIDIAKRYENHMHREGFVNFDENNQWFSDLMKQRGQKQACEFVEWVEQAYPRDRFPFTIRNRNTMFEAFLRSRTGNP